MGEVLVLENPNRTRGNSRLDNSANSCETTFGLIHEKRSEMRFNLLTVGNDDPWALTLLGEL